MGLIADIYKNGGDCSNGGLSSWADGVCLVNVDGPFSPSDRYAAALLVPGAVSGIARVIPAEEQEGSWVPYPSDGLGPMMGGCYVATSDGRFSKAVEKITGARFYGAVPLHDRYETQAQYDALSV